MAYVIMNVTIRVDDDGDAIACQLKLAEAVAACHGIGDDVKYSSMMVRDQDVMGDAFDCMVNGFIEEWSCGVVGCPTPYKHHHAS